ncbi:MAG: DNA primase [Sphingomonadales bacterium]|nr:DNA primase [Sphingomonadales bacterium]
MSLSPQWLDELRTRVSLSAVIGRTTRLTKAGHEFKACCPFHNEKSPSFTVNDAKGFYHCFGCGAHGDVIGWLCDQRGLSFIDAVRELAAEAGMELPAPDPRIAKQAEAQAGLHEVMAAAQEWFVARLAAPEGARARAYLATRGFDAHTIQRFGFGYAPEGRQALKAALARFPEALLVEAGLRIAAPPDSGSREPYDRFRDRLMLPIHDGRGRVIAFGGRILDAAKTDAPKYLNSPDTPLFDKGRTLFNLHRAGPAARRAGRLVVVEGYMDAIALAAAGIEGCVAPLGTALTEQQLAMLWRLAEVPVLCFDGDAAGQRAALRAGQRALPLLAPGHSLAFARLPAGLDPDDLVRRDGAQAMAAVLDGAMPLLDLLWESERDAVPLATPEAKAGFKARLMAHADAIAAPDIKALYRREFADRFAAFAFPRREASTPAPASANASVRRRAWPQPPPARPLPETAAARRRGASAGLIAAIVAGLLRRPGEIARNADALAPLAASDARLAALLDHRDAGGALESGAIATMLAQSGIAAPMPEDFGRIPYPFLAEDVAEALAVEALAAAIAKLVDEPQVEAALQAATERFDIEEQQRLLRRKQAINSRLAGTMSEERR